MDAQRRLFADERPQRSHERAVRHGRLDVARRQLQAQQDTQEHHQGCPEQIDRAPPERLADEAGECPGEQHTEEQSARDRPDDPATLVRRGKRRRVGDQDLRHGGADPDGEAYGREHRQRRSGRSTQ